MHHYMPYRAGGLERVGSGIKTKLFVRLSLTETGLSWAGGDVIG